MLQLLTIDQFDEFFELLSESFPKEEFRPYEQQLALLEKPYYKIYVHQQNEEIMALFATWEGPDFVFIEHFAVKETYRNGGMGSKLLQAFIKEQNKAVILESEDPETLIQKRRIEFYKRNNFILNAYGYLQPPFVKGQSTVPLLLLSYPQPLNDTTFHSFKEWAFKHVYPAL